MTQPHPDVIPVPRSRVFVLKDGAFVVQWELNRVQRMTDGRYIPYTIEQFGSAISDYELKQLLNTKLIADYDDDHVYISPLSNTQTYSGRSFYLNTTLQKSRLPDVEDAMQQARLDRQFSVRIQEIFVIIRGELGLPFRSFDEAEQARELLAARFPELLGNLVVAFIETGATS